MRRRRRRRRRRKWEVRREVAGGTEEYE